MLSFAEHIDILRAEQKDDSVSDDFRNRALQICENVFGSRWVYDYKPALLRAANGLYLFVVVVLSGRTLGQEYSDLIFVAMRNKFSYNFPGSGTGASQNQNQVGISQHNDNSHNSIKYPWQKSWQKVTEWDWVSREAPQNVTWLHKVQNPDFKYRLLLFLVKVAILSLPLLKSDAVKRNRYVKRVVEFVKGLWPFQTRNSTNINDTGKTQQQQQRTNGKVSDYLTRLPRVLFSNPQILVELNLALFYFNGFYKSIDKRILQVREASLLSSRLQKPKQQLSFWWLGIVLLLHAGVSVYKTNKQITAEDTSWELFSDSDDEEEDIGLSKNDNEYSIMGDDEEIEFENINPQTSTGSYQKSQMWSWTRDKEIIIKSTTSQITGRTVEILQWKNGRQIVRVTTPQKPNSKSVLNKQYSITNSKNHNEQGGLGLFDSTTDAEDEARRQETQQINAKAHDTAETTSAQNIKSIQTSKKEIGQELLCQICYDDAKHPTSTVCGHVFCWKCIASWVSNQQKPTCPLCRAECTGRDLWPVYHYGSCG